MTAEHEELASALEDLHDESATAREAAATIRQLSRDLEVTYGNYTNVLEASRQWEARAEALSRDLEATEAAKNDWHDLYNGAIEKLEEARGARDELRAARLAYASEFPRTEDGEPDVGSVHANIRAIKARIEVVEAALREAERLLPRLTPGNVAHIRGALMPQVRRALSPQTEEPASMDDICGRCGATREIHVGTTGCRDYGGEFQRTTEPSGAEENENE